MIPHLHYWGVPSDVTNAMEKWAAGIWPNNGYNWNLTTTASCYTDSLGYVHCTSDNP